MAYNPFNVFRRNQKAIFAVITVFIMFTFVLSSGLGGGADFFDWLPRWLGTKSKKGDVMCSIDGSRIYESELRNLRFDRVMANRFMSLAAMSTRGALEAYVADQSKRMSPGAKQALDQITQQERFLQVFGAQAPMMLQNMQAAIRQGIINSPASKSEDKEVAHMKLASLALLETLLMGGSENHFFANAPNRSNRDLVDFMLWQKKADQLGIKFTTDDIKKLIEHEFYGFFTGSSEVDVRKALQQQMAQFNLNRCIEAIGEEFRVRAAQAAVIGPQYAFRGRPDKTFGGFPLFPTSYEEFEFYREECSPTTYGAIPVPAVNFEASIPDPDESDPKIRAELRDLFDKYKNNEPNLARETPGLKEPRKVKVAWLSLTGTEPYYTKLAEEELKVGELQARVGSMLTVPLLRGSPAWIAPATAPLAANDLLLYSEYKKLADQHWAAVRTSYMRSNLDLSGDFSTLPLDSSIIRPGNLAAGAGALAGQLLAHGDPRAAAALTMTGPLAYEIRDRVKTGVPSILLALGTVPGVQTHVLGLSIGRPVPGPLPGPMLFGNMISGLAAYEALVPRPLPLEAMKPELMKTLISTTAKHLAFGDPADPKKKGDLQSFIDEVNKLSDKGKVRPADKDKFAAIQKYVTEFATKRGLTLHGNKTPRSEWNLEEAPDLAPLVEAQKKSLQTSPHQQAAQYIPFARSFFWDQTNRRSPATTLYHPEYYPEQVPQSRNPLAPESKPQFVVWRTEEIQAKTPASLADAMPAVKALWKHLKARELAEKRANELAETIRASSANSEPTVNLMLRDQAGLLAAQFAKDPRAVDRIMPFLIEGVCPLTTVSNPSAHKSLDPSLMPSFAFSPLQPFAFPPSENIKYPSRDMGKTLLDDRTKPVKTVLVLPDEPKDIYFVVTLMKRDLKTDREFQTIMAQDDTFLRQQGMPGNKGIIQQEFGSSQARKSVESIMAIIKKEFRYEETDEQKKKLDERHGSEQ